MTCMSHVHAPVRSEGEHVVLGILHDVDFGNGVGEIATSQLCTLQCLHQTPHKLVQELDLKARKPLVM